MSRLLDNWLTTYLAYTNESVSPEEYHLWIGISTIAGVLRRNVYVEFADYFNLYPNLFIVLTSPAGVCKKSTAMRLARPLMKEVPGIEFSVDSISRERLILDLAGAYQDGQSAMTAHQSEFASMLTTSKMDMVVFLTDIYDSPLEWVHKTKGTGTNTIKMPFLNMVGGTTPDWIARAMPLDTIGIGLTSRIIFVYSHTPRVKPFFPKMSPEQRKLKELLQADLVHISSIKGRYTLSPDVEEWFDQWTQTEHQEEKQGADSRIAGYYERKPMHALKVAMCVAAAQRDETVLTQDDISNALSILKKTEEGMPQVFAAVGKNPLAADVESIMLTIFTRLDGMSYAELLDMFHHSVRKEELDEVLQTLSIMGRIELSQDSERGPVYRPGRKR